MNDKEFIKCQAEKIAELSGQLIEEQNYSRYKSNCCDSLQKEITEAETKIEALKAQLEAEKEHGQRLLVEFSRALEVIRGNNLAFESPLIEAEYQSSSKKSSISVAEIDSVAAKYSNELPLLDVATSLRDRRNFINRIKATDLYKKTYTDEDLSAEFETAVHEKAKRFAFCKEKYSLTDLLKMRDDYEKAVKSLRKKSDLFPAEITFPVRTTLLALDLAIDYRKKSALKSSDLGILGVVK